MQEEKDTQQQEHRDTRCELATVRQKFSSLQKQHNQLLVTVTEAQAKQSELQLDKDHLAKIMEHLSSQRDTLAGRVKAHARVQVKVQGAGGRARILAHVEV